MKISKRLEGVNPSITLAITSQAKSLKQEGRDVVSLAAGEPDFPAPLEAAEEAHRAIRDNEGRYTDVAGLIELRRAIANSIREESGGTLNYESDEVVVTNGAKQSIHAALYVLCDENDEVIIPAPYWTSYPEMARSLGLQPVICSGSPDDEYALPTRAIAEAITPKTRVIIINSPNNPTGRVYSKAELEPIAALAKQHGLWVISDDIYSRLTYPGTTFHNLCMLDPELRDQFVLINGMSKTYCMTGWRIGYAAGPKHVIRNMCTFLGHSSSCANAIAQKAAIAALEKTSPAHLESMLVAYQSRGKKFAAAINAMPHLSCPEPTSSFYAFFRVDGAFGKKFEGEVINTAFDFARILLDAKLVATVPGEAFGTNASIRASFATSEADIHVAIQRLREFCEALE